MEKFKQLETENIDELGYGDTKAAAIGALRKMAGILLLMPGDSAYVEKDKSDTGAEKLVKREEIIREVLTGRIGR